MNKDLTLEIRANTKKAIQEINQLKKEIKNFTGGVDKSSKSLKNNASVMDGLGSKIAGLAVAFGGFQIVKSVVKTIADFEQSITKLGAISGASAENLNKLQDKARELGASTQYSAAQVADAMNYEAMAGMKTNEILTATQDVLNLASVGQMDLARASDIATDSMSGFGLEAKDMQRVTDVMAVTTTNANTNVEQLGEAFKNVAPVSKNLNVSLEETSAMLGVLANSGRKGGEAGTHLKIILQRLASTSKPVVEGLKSIGLSAYTADGKLKPMTQTLRNIQEKMKGLSEQDRNDLLKNLFGEEAIASASIVLNNLDDMDKLLKQVGDSSGKAGSMAKKMNDTLAGDYKTLNSSISELYLMIGDSLNPEMRKLTKETTEWIRSFSEEDLTSIAKSMGGIIEAFKGMAKALAFINDVAMPDWLGGKDSTFLSKSAEGWGIIGESISKFSRAISDEFEDAVATSTDKFKSLNEAVKNFDGNEKEFGQLKENIKATVRENNKFLEQMAKDDPEYYAKQIKEISTQNKKLLTTYKDLETKKPLEKAAENAEKATQATKEYSQEVEKLSDEELRKVSDTYTKRVDTHEKTIKKLYEREQSLKNKIVKLNEDLAKRLKTIDNQRLASKENLDAKIHKLGMVGATDIEKYNDKQKQADEKLFKAKIALKNGELEQYKRYKNQYESLVTSISNSEIKDGKRVLISKQQSANYGINALKQLSSLEDNYYNQTKAKAQQLHNQKLLQLKAQLNATKAQLQLEGQRLQLEKQLVEATTGKKIDIDVSGAVNAIKAIDKNIKDLDKNIAHNKKINIDNNSAINSIKKVEATYGNLQIGDIKLKVKADTTPADFGISKLISTRDGNRINIKVNPEYEEAEQKIDNAIKGFERQKVQTKVEADTTKAKNSIKNMQTSATKPLKSSVSADVAKAERSIKRMQALAKKATKSVHTIKINDNAAKRAITNLKKNTTSRHTIYVTKVNKNAIGGLIEPLTLATGGDVNFERKAGRISGYDATDSDDVPAMLTRGEFVIKRAAVAHYGDDFLYSLNNMQVPQKYATGGMVQMGTPEKLIQQIAKSNSSNGSDFNNENIGREIDLSSIEDLLRQIALFEANPIKGDYLKQLQAIKSSTSEQYNVAKNIKSDEKDVAENTESNKSKLSEINKEIENEKKQSFLKGESFTNNLRIPKLEEEASKITKNIETKTKEYTDKTETKIKEYETKIKELETKFLVLKEKYEQYKIKIEDIKEKYAELFNNFGAAVPEKIQNGEDIDTLTSVYNKMKNARTTYKDKTYMTIAGLRNTKLLDSTAYEKIQDLIRFTPKFQAGGQINGLEGGKLTGYGGGDKNLALLEDGEFIMRKEAVSKFGTDTMNKLNSMSVELPKFATGGSIGGVSLPTSMSGNTNDTTNINFNMPNGNSYAMQSDVNVATALAAEFKRLG